MADMTFNTTAGQTIDRELLIAYLNTGEASTPVWSPFGKRVTDSSMEYDWQEDSSKDILGTTRTTMKKPIITQSFDPCELDAGDAALVKLWNLAVKDQDAAALANQDVLIVHFTQAQPRQQSSRSVTTAQWSSPQASAVRVAVLLACRSM